MVITDQKQARDEEKKREDRKKEGRESGMVGETLAIEVSDASHLYGASESSN